MAKKNNSGKWLLLGAVLVGGYFLLKKNAAAAAPSLPPTTPPAPGTTTPVTTTTTTGPTGATPIQSATAAPIVATDLTMPADAGQSSLSVPYDTRMATLQQWAEGYMGAGDLAQWNTMKAFFTQDEWNGLYDLYFNAWVGGQGATPARTAFWDTWRVKYHILDGTH